MRRAARIGYCPADTRQIRQVHVALRFRMFRLAMVGDVCFGPAHQLDHVFVGHPGVVAPCEYAVVHEDDTFVPVNIYVPDRFVHLFGQDKAGHHVRQDQAVGADILHDGFPLRIIRKGNHRIGMGMIDEFGGNDGVQDSLHRRRRGGRVQHERAQLPRHFLVGQCLQVGQTFRFVESQRGKTRLLDGFQIPPAALDIQHFHVASQKILDNGLDRRIAPSVHYQVFVRSQQARGVDAQRQIVTGAGFCFPIIPQTVHGFSIARSDGSAFVRLPR